MIRAIIVYKNGNEIMVTASSYEALVKSIDAGSIFELHTRTIGLGELRQGREIFIG